jgi:calcium-binding protein CML
VQELCRDKKLRDEIADVWRRFDQDGDGSISMRELANVMTQLGCTPREDELKRMIQQVDEDGDGRIGWQEFSKMMDSQFRELDKQEQKMRRAFDYFDLKKDQYIDKDELYTVMNRLGDALTLGEADEMIRAADNDCDGLVSYAGTL